MALAEEPIPSSLNCMTRTLNLLLVIFLMLLFPSLIGLTCLLKFSLKTWSSRDGCNFHVLCHGASIFYWETGMVNEAADLTVYRYASWNNLGHHLR